jgi:hypothetical protein
MPMRCALPRAHLPDPVVAAPVLIALNQHGKVVANRFTGDECAGTTCHDYEANSDLLQCTNWSGGDPLSSNVSIFTRVKFGALFSTDINE